MSFWSLFGDGHWNPASVASFRTRRLGPYVRSAYRAISSATRFRAAGRTFRVATSARPDARSRALLQHPPMSWRTADFWIIRRSAGDSSWHA